MFAKLLQCLDQPICQYRMQAMSVVVGLLKAHPHGDKLLRSKCQCANLTQRNAGANYQKHKVFLLSCAFWILIGQ